MTRLLLIVSFLCMAATSHAAYTTAKVENVAKTPTGLQVRVDFTGDSGEPLVVAPDFSVIAFADLQAQVAAYMARLNSVNADIGKVAVGTVIMAPAVVVAPAVTPEQQFFADLSQLYALQKALAANVPGLTSSAKPYADLLAKVASEFLPAYMSDFGWPTR